MSTPVDAHHHIWRLSRGGYAWMTADSPIRRDYGLEDLRPVLGPVGTTVLVQADESEAETAFMLEAARDSGGLVGGVVGWTDLAAPGAARRIGELAREPLLKGLRPMLQDLPDRAWILRPEVGPALDSMAGHGLVLDLLIRTDQLPLVPILAARHPGLRMIIDHAAKPPIGEGLWQPWADGLARAAAVGGPVACKLSGLVTEAAPGWTTESLRPWVRHILQCFGAERVLWGSDWPVLNLAGGYGAWWQATQELLAELPEPDRVAILGGNARRLYHLG